MCKRLPIRTLLTLSCLVPSVSLHAESGPSDDAGPRVTFSGFGTLGALHTQGNGAAFIRDITQPQGASNRGLSWKTDSRFGIQANFKPTDNLETVAQVVSRYRSDNSFNPELTWGFIKYTPNDAIDVRVGRVGFDVYLAADSREVGYSYPWVRPPVEYYGTWTLLLPYEDGGDIVFRTSLGKGVARLKLYTGVARQQVSYQRGQREWAGKMTTGSVGALADLSESRVTGGFVDYQDDHWILRLGHADLKFNREIPAGLLDILALVKGTATQARTAGNLSSANALFALADETSMLHKKLSFTNLALAYENGPLQTQLAVSHMTSGSLVISDSDAGYLSVAYRQGKFTPYAVISGIRSKNSGRDDALIGQVSPAMVSVAKYVISTGLESQHTYSLGMRYDLTGNVALKLQADRIRSRSCSPVSLAIVGPSDACAPPLLWPTVPVNWNGRANVYSAVIDFIF